LHEDRARERLLKLEDELEICKSNLQSWTDSLEELAEIQDAFGTDGQINLDKATVLDIGTDCVKPLYIALKFKPYKIIGIDEGLLPFASDIKLKSKLLTETKIRFYDCSLFNDQTYQQILRREKVNKFDFVLVSKTLHHLRTAKCVAKERDRNHKCTEHEKECIYGFEEKVIFPRLLELGCRVLIYECYAPDEEDDDKIRGRGGYFTVKEWKRMFRYLAEKRKVHFIRPQQFILNKQTLSNLDPTLRKVDTLCFYVEDMKG
jgi:hypothetical protein